MSRQVGRLELGGSPGRVLVPRIVEPVRHDPVGGHRDGREQDHPAEEFGADAVELDVPCEFVLRSSQSRPWAQDGGEFLGPEPLFYNII